MAKTLSPLRYPGGKASIFPMISEIIERNYNSSCRYIEPYAGGGGLALALLFAGKAKEIHLNDLDRSIWAVWNSILNETKSFIELIKDTPVTIDEWHKQRKIQQDKHSSTDIELGFSSFFLNRTNRSGIILKAGVIGGLSQNNDKYKLDCRYNKNELIERILNISRLKSKINIYNFDAIEFLKEMDAESNIKNCFFIDPPYFEKGSSLYTNFYNKESHASIAEAISTIKSKWILTYDNAKEIKELYKNNKCYEFHLQYSLAKKRIGTELLFCSDNVNIPHHLINDVLIP